MTRNAGSLVAGLITYVVAFYVWYLVWGVVFGLLIFVPSTLDGYVWDFRVILLTWLVPALPLVFVPYWVGRRLSGSKAVGIVSASVCAIAWVSLYGYMLATQLPQPLAAP